MKYFNKYKQLNAFIDIFVILFLIDYKRKWSNIFK